VVARVAARVPEVRGAEVRIISGRQDPTLLLRTLQLDDAAKEQLGAHFGMMDANGDGFLRLDDFEIIASRSSTLSQAAKSKALMYFTKLQEELDFNSDGKIEPEEFIRGMIKIAYQKPVDQMLRTPPAGTDPIDYAISRLEVAANNAVKELCKGLAAWMQSI
jgi:Ca2+-binding EF-hand superfamily protein